jgi:hypothetical protein
MINIIDGIIDKTNRIWYIISMRKLALTLGFLVTATFLAFAMQQQRIYTTSFKNDYPRDPQIIWNMLCLHCHDGKRSPSAEEFHEMFAGRKRLLISVIKKRCKFVLSLPKGEQEAIINWLSAKHWKTTTHTNR